MEEQARNYVQITTKLNPETFKRVQELCARRQLKPYKMLQNMVDTIVRYMDDRHNLTPELEEVMRIFEHMDGWDKTVLWTDWDKKAEISDATYYLRSEDKQGVRAVHVERPFFGEWSEDKNIQHILERTFCLLVPNRYKQLRQIAVERHCSSILQLIDQVCNELQTEQDARELRKPFEENNMSEHGRKMWDQRFKRKNNKDIEKMSPGLNFRPFDVEG